MQVGGFRENNEPMRVLDRKRVARKRHGIDFLQGESGSYLMNGKTFNLNLGFSHNLRYIKLELHRLIISLCIDDCTVTV